MQNIGNSTSVPPPVNALLKREREGENAEGRLQALLYDV
jgi:hypothetical protein